MGKKGNEIHIYEVKCSNKTQKAKKQLKRIKKLLGKENIQLFIFNGESNRIQAISTEWKE